MPPRLADRRRDRGADASSSLFFSFWRPCSPGRCAPGHSSSWPAPTTGAPWREGGCRCCLPRGPCWSDPRLRRARPAAPRALRAAREKHPQGTSRTWRRNCRASSHPISPSASSGGTRLRENGGTRPRAARSTACSKMTARSSCSPRCWSYALWREPSSAAERVVSSVCGQIESGAGRRPQK